MSEMRHKAEAFACAPALRLEAHERVSKLHYDQFNEKLVRMEMLMERLEKRLWLTVYGVAGVILAEAFQSLMKAAP
ncbi:MAG: hypothetical protein N4A61_05045 [Pelagimonas sp.]|jgi:hypothetical protein|nr:hypothetical protein [Pelagimonas sp.]